MWRRTIYPLTYKYYFINKFLNPVCDLLDPLFENTKEEIFGELINQCKPPPKKREPALSTMKKSDLIEECKRLGLDFEGKNAELKDRIKNARVQARRKC